MDKEKLIKSIMAEYEKDGEPITREEAEEIAEMEIKAKGIKNYVQADITKPRKPRERKVDTEKAEILDYLKKGLVLLIDSTTIVTENEVRLHFPYGGNDYTVTLTKHNKKKG